ncbi:glycosyltransferase [Streptomyces sp. NBC_01304]|uniref:glycosyltransferase n=1 Tax=Streptomyces sp. NBC_01304 TaxID=2903818 RepID=UPI002E129C84|nr:glycosyltransferase [Streptomyces sp. NBC_01304]
MGKSGTPAPPVGIVSPPTDEEMYAYLGPQRRWVLICMSASYVFGAVTLFLFALRAPALWGFMVILGLNSVAWILASLDGQSKRRLSKESHLALVEGWAPSVRSSIDIFLPSCGEPLDVLRNTFHHVSRLEWDGKLRVWVLDDSGSPEVALLADEFGFEYRSRPNRGHLKKAGNLNYGLQHCDGEFVTIFDADFCPRPDFLHHLMPYFDDPGTGIVQSPHCFDTGPGQSWLERASGAWQEIFFRWLMPSRDADGASICCGSCAVYRRSALNITDGFAKLSHSEDMYTSIAMKQSGFSTRYVPVQLAKGLSPDTLSAAVNQQYRWCMGNLQLMVNRDFYRMKMPWRARAAYFSGFANYIAGAINIFMLPLPMAIMYWFSPMDIRAWHVLPLLVPAWVFLVLLPSVATTRWRFEALRGTTLFSVAHGVAFLHLLKGRHSEWVPTGAAAKRNPLAHTVSKIALIWFSLINVVLCGGAIYAAVDGGVLHVWGSLVFVASYLAITVPLIREALLTLRPSLGPVVKLLPAPRHLARTLAVPVESPSTSSTRTSIRHAESTHQTPRCRPPGNGRSLTTGPSPSKESA